MSAERTGHRQPLIEYGYESRLDQFDSARPVSIITFVIIIITFTRGSRATVKWAKHRVK